MHYLVQYKNACLDASDIKEYRCLKNVIHQLDSKNLVAPFQQVLPQNLTWFLSLTLETLFLKGFILNSNSNSIDSSKKLT